MKRTWDERRNHRNRIIKKRRDRYTNAYQSSGVWNYGGPWLPEHLGTFDKNNVTCSCWMCRGPKHNRSKAKREAQREIDEWITP